MKKNDVKIAIVSHPLDVLGGAEKVLIHLLKEFPTADVFTARSSKEFRKKYLRGVKVKNSFIQYIPFEKHLRKELYLLYPWAYRSFSFFKYDIVISICDGFPKFIRPLRRKTKHIAYILTPPKFLWMHEERTITNSKRITYKIYKRFVSTFLEKIWQRWDRNAARNVDYIYGISEEVAKRIKKFYDLDPGVIYPPVEVKEIRYNKDQYKRENWFLYLGRVETYKGVDLAIRACHLAKKPLKIAGDGQHIEDMKRLVKELNAKGIVKFLGFFDEDTKRDLLYKCKALLFPVRAEDFGIVPVEANASGAPVIAYKDGGVLETISEKNPKTGILFSKYTPECLAEKLKSFDPDDFDPANCRKQANQFAGEIFQYKMRNLVNDVLQDN